ncbi:hypothetical protein NGRA_0282 [Nosema granulosis]|uniref:Arrestin-like N-terminal domain-containing protein n=1 Tax=Nosema granulosis TaxID=83296 RepID=A0A9P6H0M3_9MICR|nr:hypothetical protein NGRA_0282 [Nosema granulosis]
MEDDTVLKISLDKSLYGPGEFVTGTVSLKTRTPISMNKLILTLTKQRMIDVCKMEPDAAGNKQKYRDDSTIYKHEFVLYKTADSTNEISSGCHTFPFKFSLKSSDNSSTDIKGIYFDYLVNIQNSYKLSCDLYLFGAYEPMYEASKPIQVSDNLEKEKEFKVDVEMSSIMCLYYKSYSLFFKLNKELFFSGDQLVLEIGFQNMGKHIKNIDCNIYEILSVSTPEINFIRTRYIVGGDAHRTNNGYCVELRIPSSTPTSVSETEFNLKTVMFITITMHKSSPIRVKKYLQVVKKNLEIPHFDHLNVLDGEVFEEKVFILN